MNEKGVHLDVEDFDQLFKLMSNEALFVNDFDVNSQDGKARLRDMLHVRYDGDTLDILPSCDCGKVTGQFNVGVTCKECRTKVMAVTERPLESTLWFRLPKNVRAFINPAIWVILSKAFSQSEFNLIYWLCSPTYKAKKGYKLPLKRLEPYKLNRGLNHFVENFDEIMDLLFRVNPTKIEVNDKEVLMEFIRQNRHKVFCQYLPIPSKLTFIVENTSVGIYADKTMRGAMDAILTLTSIETSSIPVSQKVRENRTVAAMAEMADYFNTFIKENLATKHGWIRKHVLGSRLHFTFRAVISSLSDNHEYDELHLPWSMSVMAFKIHLTSKLLKRQLTVDEMKRYGLHNTTFSPNEATQFLFEHTLKYHPLLEELFKEILAETKGGRGYPCLFSRNPTLQRGSVYSKRITHIKTNPKVNTISMSVLTLKAPNADFDGLRKLSLNFFNCWKPLRASLATA